MIEKIKEKKGNYTPCIEVIRWTEVLKENRGNISVAEIGVDIGATAVEIIQRINKGDKYYFFDIDSKVEELTEDFKTLDCEADLIGISNTVKWRDCYAWNLAKLYLEDNVRFDLVYLDGVHDFLHDAAATAVLKQMINPGGIIIFDDIDWCFANSPTSNPIVNPKVLDMYTNEQISSCMVDIVVKCLMDSDIRFEKLENSENRHRVAYKRV